MCVCVYTTNFIIYFILIQIFKNHNQIYSNIFYLYLYLKFEIEM